MINHLHYQRIITNLEAAQGACAHAHMDSPTKDPDCDRFSDLYNELDRLLEKAKDCENRSRKEMRA